MNEVNGKHVVLFSEFGQPMLLADTPKRARLTSEMGKGGVTYFSGYANNDEFNNDLTGNEGIDTYDKMRRTDAQVQAIILAVTLPLISARWVIDRDDDDEDTTDEHIEFARKNLFQNISWEETIKHALTCVWAGFSWFEKVYQLRDGKLELSKLAPRLATTQYTWTTDKNENLTGIVQRLDDGEREPVEINIPWPSKAVLFSFQKEGNNYEGMSLLRAAYKHWFIKDQIYHIDAIRIERFALGMPHIQLPEEYDQGDLNALESLGKEWKAGSQSFVITPHGVELDVISMPQGSVLDVLPTINHHNEEIGKSGLAQFLNNASSGTIASGETATEFFYDAIRSVANWMAEEINTQIIEPLMDLNFRGQPRPKMRATEIGAVSFPQMVRFLREVGEIFVQPDPNIEDHLRSMMSLPRRSDETPRPKAQREEEREEQNLEIQRENHDIHVQQQEGEEEGNRGARDRAQDRQNDRRGRTGNRTVQEEESRRVQRLSEEYDSEEWPTWVYQAVAELAKADT